jgi:hypothetical protein
MCPRSTVGQVSELSCGASVRDPPWGKFPRSTLGKFMSFTLGKVSVLLCGEIVCGLMWGKCPRPTMKQVFAL